MSGSKLAAIALVVLAGCGPRKVEVVFHTPDRCAPIGEDGGPRSACPLGAVRSIETVLERVDGTQAAIDCVPAPAGLCEFEDLRNFLFIGRAEPSDGVEIRMTGWTGPSCRDAMPPELALRCETLGSAVIDLAAADEVPVFCDCPYIASP